MELIPENLNRLLPRCNESIITSDMSISQVAVLQLERSILKKLEPTSKKHTRAADKAALDLFIESNEQCKHWELDTTSYHYDTMLRARDKLRDRFYSGELQAPRLSMRKALDCLKPGPGASLGTKLTDFVGKVFNSQMTTYDSGLWDFYKRELGSLWQLAEFNREKHFGPAQPVKGSNLTFAKKNFDISRVINTEASLEMLFQLGYGTLLEGCLEDWFNINLSTQPTMNRFLAKLGSIYGSHATIDLKSASDLNSTRFAEWFLPPVMFKTLDQVRAKCIKLPSGEYYELGTFSTMGNGFTFPLQTLVFASIVEAAYEELGLTTWNQEGIPAFSVFGDDIICVKSAYDKVCSLLEFCGFVVNKTKSFNSGGFRESCGADYFRGHDVRGVYLKKMSHETHVYSIFNRLTRWSIRQHVDLSTALRYLKGLAIFRPVPFDQQDIAGFKMPLSLANAKSRCGVSFFKHYAAKPRRIKTSRYEKLNLPGLLVAALGGYLEGDRRSSLSTGSLDWDSVFKPMPEGYPMGSITLRDKPDGDPRVTLRRSSTSSWDWIPHKGLTTLCYTMVFACL